MSLSRIIHHSHLFTRLEIYHHIYFIKWPIISQEELQEKTQTGLQKGNLKFLLCDFREGNRQIHAPFV